MTVQKDVTKNIYVGNGSTRTFPFTFECPAEHPEYIKVYLMQDDGTALATSDYQLDMDARQITYPSSGTALPEGKKLVIMRELPLQQMMNLVNNGPYFAEDVELAFDENVMAMQQIAEKLNRSIIMSVDIDGDAFVNEVPFEAGKSFRIADDGKSIVLTEDPARVLPLAQEAYAQAQAQAQSAYASAAAAAEYAATATTKASETTAKVIEATDEANRAKAEADRAKSISDNIGNPVSDVTENNGTVTVMKADGSSSNFTTFPKFVELPADADLNDYKQEGFYICKTNKGAVLLKNCPAKMAFLMEVYNTSYEGTEDSWSHQRIITFNASQVYTRAYGSWEDAGWYPWESIPAIGTILPFAGANSIPTGYLVCDGSQVSRTTYKNLFDAIGTTYGTGDGSTTFNLPNLTEKFIQGSDTVGTVKSAGLPNINGSVLFRGSDNGGLAMSETLPNDKGAFNVSRVNTIFNTAYTTIVKGSGQYLYIDASRSSSVYGNSTTVQPPALTMRYIIKY